MTDRTERRSDNGAAAPGNYQRDLSGAMMQRLGESDFGWQAAMLAAASQGNARGATADASAAAAAAPLDAHDPARAPAAPDAQQIVQALVDEIALGVAPASVAARAVQQAIAQGAVHIRIHVDDGPSKSQWSRSTPTPLCYPVFHSQHAAGTATMRGRVVQVAVWLEVAGHAVAPTSASTSALTSTPSSTPSSTRSAASVSAPVSAPAPPVLPPRPDLVTSRLVTLPPEAGMALAGALPDWAVAQQATEVQRVLLTMGGDIGPLELMNFLTHAAPEPFAVAPRAPHATFDPARDYSVIGRFASGAVRTIGRLAVDGAGAGAVKAFGYWSLIDPDDDQLDPENTSLIESVIDFVAVEVT